MKCCICGTVKNCGPYLYKVLSNMEKIGSLFDDYKILIYYDKSDDNTLDILKDYPSKNLFYYVNKNPLFKLRTSNIAKGRNFCLDRIRNNYIDYDYFIMMDCDDVNCKELDINPIINALKRNDWDGLSFNTNPYYYDLYALSIKPYFLNIYSIDKTDEISQIIKDYIINLLNSLEPNELLTCASAFNGFSIYRTNKFIDCNYNGLTTFEYVLLSFDSLIEPYKLHGFNYNFVLEDCEHRAFHFEAITKNNAKIMISPEKIFI